jgi:hypothetical protein
MSFSWFKGKKKENKQRKRKIRVSFRDRHHDGETGRQTGVSFFEPSMGCDTPRPRGTPGLLKLTIMASGLA